MKFSCLDDLTWLDHRTLSFGKCHLLNGVLNFEPVRPVRRRKLLTEEADRLIKTRAIVLPAARALNQSLEPENRLWSAA